MMNSHFFILTAPRSGSTVLTRTLDQHPEIFCAGELFHPGDDIYHPEWHFRFWGTKKKKGNVAKIFCHFKLRQWLLVCGKAQSKDFTRPGNRVKRSAASN
jgi:hypothetical protein